MDDSWMAPFLSPKFAYILRSFQDIGSGYERLAKSFLEKIRSVRVDQKPPFFQRLLRFEGRSNRRKEGRKEGRENFLDQRLLIAYGQRSLTAIDP
jgi:hypothetical protein